MYNPFKHITIIESMKRATPFMSSCHVMRITPVFWAESSTEKDQPVVYHFETSPPSHCRFATARVSPSRPGKWPITLADLACQEAPVRRTAAIAASKLSRLS